MKRDTGMLRDHALERQVLVAAIGEHAKASFTSLRKEIFDKSENLAVFRVVCDMITSSRHVDTSSLAAELAQRNPYGWHGNDRELESAYFAEAIELTQRETGIDWTWAVARLGQLATARAQDETAMAILASLYGPLPDGADERDPFDIKQEAIGAHLSKLSQLGTSRLAQLDSLVTIVDDGKETGAVPSGFSGLDYIMAIGGIPKGQLTVVRAKHKGGKSLLMRSMFYRDIQSGIKALYVTFADISKVHLKRLLIQADTGCKRPPGNLEKLADYDESVAFFHEHYAPFGFIIDAFGVSDDTTIEDILQVIKAHHEDNRFEKIYLDYAQKISSRDPRARAGSVAEFDVVCRKAANFIHHLGPACVIGSQMTSANKATGDAAKTKLGRRLEEEAGLVLEARKAETDIEIEVVYNRWGEASVDGGTKKLIVGGLLHDYSRHIIMGQGTPKWKDGDTTEPYIRRD